MPAQTSMIIVPLYRDEWLIRKVLQEMCCEAIYLLSAQLSQEEIRDQISGILRISDNSAEKETNKARGDGKVFSLMSYGASGVTTFCINFPVLLARQQQDAEILVLDMNAAKPDLSRFFKLQKYQLALYRPDFLDANIAGRRSWKQVCKQSEFAPNLFYAHAANKWRSAEISNMIEVFRKQFDYVYVDWGYCVPETETLYRIMEVSDHNLLFARADPFGIESAREWIRGQRERGATCEVLLSHLDKGQPFRIGEEVSLYGVLPRISESRLWQSQRSSSVLVEELFPPKTYINSLIEIAKAEYSGKSAVLSG
jgi:cellulose biosynthesis protein BcsQ